VSYSGNCRITQSAKQRRSHLHKISVLVLCNLVVLYAGIHTILSKYNVSGVLVFSSNEVVWIYAIRSHIRICDRRSSAKSLKHLALFENPVIAKHRASVSHHFHHSGGRIELRLNHSINLSPRFFAVYQALKTHGVKIGLRNRG